MYAQSQASAVESGAADSGSGAGAADDEVVEAEIVDEDKPGEEGGAA
jgi:hypothetical protein